MKDNSILPLFLGPLAVLVVTILAVVSIAGLFKFLGYAFISDPCTEPVEYCGRRIDQEGFSKCVTDTIQACKEERDALQD